MIPRWKKEGLDIIIIDHDSTDGSAEWIQERLGKEIDQSINMPWLGNFSLKQQLETKKKVIKDIKQQWIIHLDADEWPQSCNENETLIEAIKRVDQDGYNAINFNEFVFLPIKGSKKIEHYYFFEPNERRLMRAWRRNSKLDNNSHGGHKLAETSEKLNLAEESFTLRHYIINDEQSANEKYLTRNYNKDEIRQGWHKNRLKICARNLILPDAIYLNQAIAGEASKLATDTPHKLHYWQWDDGTKRKKLKTLICLYGCEKDNHLLDTFNNSEIGEMIKYRNDVLLLEIWGDGKTNKREGARVTLRTEDKYNLLSLKTHEMVKYCCQHFKFKQLIKLDLTCMKTKLEGKEYEARRPVDTKKLMNYLQYRMNNTMNDSKGDYYDGLYLHKDPTIENIKTWAKKKSANISLNRAFQENKTIPSFYSGKCYCISNSFCQYIARNGYYLAKIHSNYLNGSEDLMIGRLAEIYSRRRIK